jgi:diguanylate cyclase (GGDEF)-like protein/PAS domain S-box-containing protein
MLGSPPPVPGARSRRWVRVVPFVLAIAVGVGGSSALVVWHTAQVNAEARKAQVSQIVSLADNFAAVYGRLGLSAAAGKTTKAELTSATTARAHLVKAVAQSFPDNAATRRDPLATAVVRQTARVAAAGQRTLTALGQHNTLRVIQLSTDQLIPGEVQLNRSLDRISTVLAQRAQSAEARSGPASVATVLAMLALLLAIGAGGRVAERRRSRGMQAELEERERWFRSLVERSGDLTLVLDAGGIVRFVAPGGAEMLGLEQAQVLDHDIVEFLREGDDNRFLPLWDELLACPGGQLRLDLMLCHADGDRVHLEAVCTNLLDDHAVRGVVVNTRDVTERRDLERQLMRRAYRDELTGLANRAEFIGRLEYALANAGRDGEFVAVLFLDLNGFKAINDTLGHAAGDEVLVTVAQRARAALRPSDTVARLAGDEFTVLIESIDDEEDALEAATRIVNSIAMPTFVMGQEIKIGVSGGLAFGNAGTNSADLLRDADTAMYEAKAAPRAAGQGSIVMFEAEMTTRAWSRLRGEGGAA